MLHSYIEGFLLISGVSRFSFFTTEHFRKHGNLGKFISRGIKIIYLTLSTFPSHLCVQDTILKVLLKVFNEKLPLMLLNCKNGTEIANSVFF